MDAEGVKYVLQNRTTVEPYLLTAEVLKEAGCLERVCVLPIEYKERMSYLADVLVQSLSRSSNVKDDRLRATIGQLSQALSYMMNSCSWQEGQLHDFDYEELQRKLKRFVRSTN